MPQLTNIPKQAYTPTSTRNSDTHTIAGHMYHDPAGNYGKPVQSTIGEQETLVWYQRKALVEAAKERKFTRLASVKDMPKHHGKTIGVWKLYPLLDARNLNDQGIDARGAYIENGNLYGSSRDIGNITKFAPVIAENGGRVNRVGFTRQKVVGTFFELGFFYEYSKDALDFDSDPYLYQNMYNELLIGAEQISEDLLQIDLINGAGTLVYAGGATQDSEMDETSELSFKTLSRLNQALDKNDAPRSTKIITGSTKYDTRTVSSSRVLFVPSEVVPMLEVLRNGLGEPAFVPIEKYADSLNSTGLKDEVGTIARFRVVQYDRMLRWEGHGAEAENGAYYSTNGKYDIFPLLCVSSESFTCISVHGSNGVKNKFLIQEVKPKASLRDPYGKMGLTSISWFHGTLIIKPEQIGLIKTVVPQ